MFKTYIVQNIEHGNEIVKVTRTKWGMMRYAKRILRHSRNTLVCTIWYRGEKLEDFTLNKNTLFNLK